MKKSYLILLIQFLLLVSTNAQVIPKGMNYQAVARNLKGELLQNQKINLKISLYGQDDQLRTYHYRETHEVTTNKLGLFNLVVGEGKITRGQFGLIPWNTQNIWMEVAIKDKSQAEFASISSSKLQSVPYAIHAGTASQIINKTTLPTAGFAPPEPGVISNTWSVFGNAKTNEAGNPYHINALGTTDLVDLILITDNIERLRIRSTGDIVTKLNFNVGKNLSVGQNMNVIGNATIGDSLIIEKNVRLNTVSGVTINYGPFTVQNQSPTYLTGQLTVDQATDLKSTLNVDGNTDINARFFVNRSSPTYLTGTLQVDSVTNLNDALTVTNQSPTYLSGTLRVDSMATFMDRFKITSQFSTDTSGIAPSGAIQVNGGTYIRENLYIGGVAKFGGPVAFGGAVTIQDQTQSTSPGTGALKVSGGVGIGLNLNVGAAAMIGGMTTIQDVTESMDSLTGAMKVLGGVSIRKRLNVGGVSVINKTLQVHGVTTLNSTLGVYSSDPFVASFTNYSNQNGISIKINNAAPGWANNFVEFRNGNSFVVGRIEGQNSSEYLSNANYNRELTVVRTDLKFAEITVVTAAYHMTGAILGVVAAAASSTTCAGLGVCGTVPIVSLIIKSLLEAGARATALARAVIVRDDFIDRKSEFVSYYASRIGVTYESGSGDYAEWLPKADTAEHFLPGYIVGLKNGQISKHTDATNKLLVISTKPIVLGNMPDPEQKEAYEKVAFMGQVPVFVLGKVNAGDYILPSGNHDGTGKAIAPSSMQTEDYINIVGVAWSSSDKDAYKLINVAIGLNDGDISKVVVEHQHQLEDLQSKVDQANLILSKLIPGFKEAAGINEADASKQASLHGPVGNPARIDLSGFNRSGSDYTEISKEQVLDVMNTAEQSLALIGANPDDILFWKRIRTEPGYKDFCIRTIQGIYKHMVQVSLENAKSRQ